MADIVSARDDQSQALARGLSAPREQATARRAQGRRDRPRSDIGTLIIHWLTALAFFVSVFTGVRIAADDPDAVVSKWLEPILPQGEIWTWHFFAGLTLFFCASAYILYMARSGLMPRIALKKIRAFLIPNAGKLRYDALNVVLHWLVYVVIVVLTVTGIFLYLGHGGWLLTVHLAAAFTGIAYTLAHLLSHFLYGGLQQWLRLFRPAALVPTHATRPPFRYTRMGNHDVGKTRALPRLRRRYVPGQRPLLTVPRQWHEFELGFGRAEVSSCDGSGVCATCGGTGMIEPPQDGTTIQKLFD